jgi:hypothetical protein
MFGFLVGGLGRILRHYAALGHCNVSHRDPAIAILPPRGNPCSE